VADDFADGIAPNISVGYEVHEYERASEFETTDENGDVVMPYWRAISWTPWEASAVPLPADPTVGLEGKEAAQMVVRFSDPNDDPAEVIKSYVARRSLQKRNFKPEQEVTFIDDDAAGPARGRRTMPVKDELDPPVSGTVKARERAADDPAPRISEAERSSIRDQERHKELERQREIRAIGAKFSLKGEIVEKALQDGMPADSFRKQLTDTWTPDMTKRIDPKIGMNAAERSDFRVTRAIDAMLSDNWDVAGFEREICQEARKKSREQGLDDFGGKGFIIPLDVQMDMYHQRSKERIQIRANLTAGAAEGIELVGTEHRGDLFIDALRNRVAVIQAGAQVLDGLVGNVVIPRQTAAIAAGISATEVTAFTEGAPTYDQLSLSPKIANAKQPVSQLLIQQGSPAIEAMLRRDLTLAIGIKIDAMALYGAGSSGEPTGIAATSGVGSVDFGEVAATWAKVVEAESDLGAANADVDDLRWILNAKSRGVFKTTPKVSGYPDYLWDARVPNNPLNGYRAHVSNQARSNLGTGTNFSEAFFGNWPECILPMWGGLYILPDPYSSAGTNLVIIYIRQFFDVGLRHPASFTRALGIPNA